MSDDSFKNWRMIIFISVLAVIMIASSHSADKKVHEIAKLNNEVKELRSAFVDGRKKTDGYKNGVIGHTKNERKGFISFVNSAKKNKSKITKLKPDWITTRPY